MGDRKYNLEIKVGIFVFLALIMLIVIIFSIADFHLLKPGYNLKLYFNYTGGLEVGAPVRLAGVKVGEVKDINVIHKRKLAKTIVEVKIWVEEDTIIRKDSIAEINTLGLLGEKYLEITPGSKGAILKDQGILIGEDPIPVSEFTTAGYNVFKELEKTVESINSLFGDKEVLESFRDMVENSKNLSKNLINLTETTQEIIDKINQGEGTLGRLLMDDSLYNKIDSMVEDIRRHPWRLLYRPPQADEEVSGNRGYIYKRNQN